LGDELPIVIVANKFDLNSRRVIKREELKDYVKSVVTEEKDKDKDYEITSELLNGLSQNSDADAGKPNVLWIECSAKSGMGVENAFLGLSYMMLQRRRIKTDSKSLSKTTNKSNRELNLKKGSVSRSTSRRNIVVLNQDDDSNTQEQQNGRTKKKCCIIQ
jgi:GTPase SAR1 family protein